MTDALKNLIADAREWKTDREALSAREEGNDIPSANEWETSDDVAADIARALADIETSHASGGYSLHSNHVSEPAVIDGTPYDYDAILARVTSLYPDDSGTLRRTTTTQVWHRRPTDLASLDSYIRTARVNVRLLGPLGVTA